VLSFTMKIVVRRCTAAILQKFVVDYKCKNKNGVSLGNTVLPNTWCNVSYTGKFLLYFQSGKDLVNLGFKDLSVVHGPTVRVFLR